MSIKDLIAQWEHALAEAHLAASRAHELGDGDLEAAGAPGVAAKSGLLAGCGPVYSCGTGEGIIFTC
jgi:hypothetical protein